MPRVLPILSRPSNLLRRRKNIHWSPLLHHDTTFPVPRRITNSIVFNPKCNQSLAYCFSVDYLAPRSPPLPSDAPPTSSATEGGGRDRMGGDRGATRGGRGPRFFVLFRHVSPPSLLVAPPRFVGSPHWPWAWPRSSHS